MTIEQQLNKLVGSGYCIRPKVLLTNDEAGWYATYLPEAPKVDGEIQVLGNSPEDALTLLLKALGVKE